MLRGKLSRSLAVTALSIGAVSGLSAVGASSAQAASSSNYIHYAAHYGSSQSCNYYHNGVLATLRKNQNVRNYGGISWTGSCRSYGGYWSYGSIGYETYGGSVIKGDHFTGFSD